MIYFDNAATTWPKPEEVYQAVDKCQREIGANPGRGGHGLAQKAAGIIESTRENVSRFFNIKNSSRLVFTPNATAGLNLALKGSLRAGDHVIASTLDHNSILRPLYKLFKKGVMVTLITSTPEGHLSPLQIKKALRKNTRLVCLNHASNVTGTISPVYETGEMLKGKKVKFLVDGAQTAGIYPIDVEEAHIDFLAVPGHKGLLGPQGTGCLYVREGITLESLQEGGTGSQSEKFEQPLEMPSYLESGTPNTPGIAGLGAGINFINNIGIDQVKKHKSNLLGCLLEGLKTVNGLNILGPVDPLLQAPLASFNLGNINSREISYLLDKYYSIATRAGLHCAPLVHKTMGTKEQGAVRVSLGFFNNASQVDELVRALKSIVKEFSL